MEEGCRDPHRLPRIHRLARKLMSMRTCEDCGKDHSRRSGRCVACADSRRKAQQKQWREENHREYMRNWRIRNPEKNRAYDRSETAKAHRRERWLSSEGRAKGRFYAKRRYAKVEQQAKRRARNAVSNEIRSGRLIPPNLCEECNTDPGRGSDGRRLIRADHYLGYDEQHWLDVRWLCIHCDGKKERIGVTA